MPESVCMGSDSVHADPFDPDTLIQFWPSLRSDVHRSWCIVGANFIALRERSEFGCETTSRGGLVNPGYFQVRCGLVCVSVNTTGADPVPIWIQYQINCMCEHGIRLWRNRRAYGIFSRALKSPRTQRHQKNVASSNDYAWLSLIGHSPACLGTRWLSYSHQIDGKWTTVKTLATLLNFSVLGLASSSED